MAVTRYDIRYRVPGTPDWTQVDSIPLQTSYRVEGLRPGTVYELQVRAHDSEGEGRWSSSGLGATTQGTAYSFRHRRTGATDWAVVEFLPDPAYRAEGLDPGTEYEAQVRAANRADESEWTASGTASTQSQATAPVFADDTGDAVTWTVGAAIDAIIVPEASGTPAPAYAVEGSLPSGLSFDDSTRQLTGTPEAAGTGTIVIRATNSAGFDDYSIPYTISSPPNVAPTVTIDTLATIIDAGATLALAATADDPDGTIASHAWTGQGSFDPADAEDTTWTAPSPAAQMAYTLRLTVTDDDGAEAHAEVMITVRAAAATAAPVFADDTGDPISGTVEQPITTVTVPEATGTPAPTYVVVGDLPAGVSFTEREVTEGSGNEQTIDLLAADWGTIGSSRRGWTYATARPQISADLVPENENRYLAYANVGDVTVSTFSVISVSFDNASSGFDEHLRDLTDTFENSGSIEFTVGEDSWLFSLAGIDVQDPYSFTPTDTDDLIALYSAVTTRVAATLTLRDYIPTTRTVYELVFNEDAIEAGSGMIRIRAANSEGFDDWTVGYSFAAAPVAPFFADDTGDTITGTAGQAIEAVTVPEAVGPERTGNSQDILFPASWYLGNVGDSRRGWGRPTNSDAIPIDSELTPGSARWLASAYVRNTGRVDLFLVSNLSETNQLTGDDLSPLFERRGQMSFEAGGGTVTVSLASADPTEPYVFTPPNSDEVSAFYNTLPIADDSLAGALTIRDFVAGRHALLPAPTYAVVGNLPGGLNFNTGTRVLSGTPTAAGSGTIRIRATNSVDSDDWTVTYSVRGGTRRNRRNRSSRTTPETRSAATVGTAISAVAIPPATGNPNPAYSQIGASPSGITVTLPTLGNDGSITGTPTAAGKRHHHRPRHEQRGQ